MPTPTDHAFFVVLAVLFPLWAALFGLRRLRRTAWEDLPRARLWLYRRAIAIQWTLTFAMIAWWLRAERGWDLIGLAPRVTPGAIGVLVGLLVVTTLVVRQRNEALRSDEALEGVRHQLTRLELMLPRSRYELSWFYGLSVTAGLCEELLYRGFMTWYLAHRMGEFPAIVVAAALFGVAHAYQGLRGILLTGAVGLFLGAIYWVSGSLYLGMVAHALMDVHSGHLGYVALTRPPRDAALGEPAPAFEPAMAESGADPEIGPERTASEHADVAMEPPPNSMTEPRG